MEILEEHRFDNLQLAGIGAPARIRSLSAKLSPKTSLGCFMRVKRMDQWRSNLKTPFSFKREKGVFCF